MSHSRNEVNRPGASTAIFVSGESRTGKERPDVDRVYHDLCAGPRRTGGWPDERLADAELSRSTEGPIFHPKNRWGRPGFVAILTALAQALANEQEQLLTEGERVTEALRQYSGSQNSQRQIPNSKGQTQNPDPKNRNAEPDLGVLVRQATRRAKNVSGNSPIIRWRARRIRRAPKFPRAAVFNFLFRSAVGPIAENGNRNVDKREGGILSGTPRFYHPKSPAQP